MRGRLSLRVLTRSRCLKETSVSLPDRRRRLTHAAVGDMTASVSVSLSAGVLFLLFFFFSAPTHTS